MNDNVCTNVQISKLITNSRDPIVVETKTTTTTTVRRIFANIDITDIQSMLDIKDIPQTNSIDCTLAPKADVTSNQVTIHDTVKCKSNELDSNQNTSLLSSTKIDAFAELNEIDTGSLAKNITTSEKHFTIKNRNMDKKKRNNKLMKTKKEKKTVRPMSTTNSVNKVKYIDGLINEYMELEKKPRREKEFDKEFEPPDAKDLSAIFELSNEVVDSRETSISTSGFGTYGNAEFEYQHKESSKKNVSPNKEKENKNIKRKLSKIMKEDGADNFPKRAKNFKNISKVSEKKKKSFKKETRLQDQPQDSKNLSTNNKKSPIKIYSPSTRGKLRTDADNRLVLTKKMIKKKLQNYPQSSQLLRRLGKSNEMVVDADSRLIYYPQEHVEYDEEESNLDFLSFCQKRSKPLLVKEKAVFCD